MGLIGPYTPLPRKRGRVTLRGLYKVPLASENSLQFLGGVGIPRMNIYRNKINPRASLY
jgi:hypothetical protein